ncbi:MAG: IS3 family transposase [Verrucomicrobia bacterium]|nr:IS3 family transposase [Verrucomicrobiota bacterium]
MLGRRTSRNRIARRMRQERLWARQRSKFRVPTTDSRHSEPIAPNRLAAVQAQSRDQVRATDATAILTGEGWLYLVALLDLHTRRVVGWAMDRHLDAAVAVRALQMAITQRRPAPGLIVHSDRGTQFASAAFRGVLARHGLCASMSRQGNCYDNAHVESFWSSLKYETVYRHRYPTRATDRAALFDYIESFDNRTRLHSSLGYVSPVAFEHQMTQTKSPGTRSPRNQGKPSLTPSGRTPSDGLTFRSREALRQCIEQSCKPVRLLQNGAARRPMTDAAGPRIEHLRTSLTPCLFPCALQTPLSAASSCSAGFWTKSGSFQRKANSLRAITLGRLRVPALSMTGCAGSWE